MKIKITSAALQDIKDIKEYISNVLANPDAAKRTIDKIRQSYLSLSDTPFIGISLKNKININTSYRFLTSENYLIFYFVKEKTVIISRIIYGRRDYAKILFDTELKKNKTLWGCKPKQPPVVVYK